MLEFSDSPPKVNEVNVRTITYIRQNRLLRDTQQHVEMIRHHAIGQNLCPTKLSYLPEHFTQHLLLPIFE